MRHAYLFSSLFLPNIIKIYLRVLKVCSAKEFVCGRTEISASGSKLQKEERESCLSCMPHAHWSFSLLLPNIINLFQIVYKLWPAQVFGFSKDINIMKKVRVVSLARDMPTGLLFILTKNYQNMFKGIKVMKRTKMRLRMDGDFCFRGDNYITKKVRVISLARETRTGPPLHLYQILSNYLKQYGSYGCTTFGLQGRSA